MKKCFYIGVRYDEFVTSATGAPRKRTACRWNSVVYPTAEQAATAAAGYMAKKLGMSFFIQGFDRPLKIVDGISQGFMEEG